MKNKFHFLSYTFTVDLTFNVVIGKHKQLAMSASTPMKPGRSIISKAAKKQIFDGIDRISITYRIPWDVLGKLVRNGATFDKKVNEWNFEEDTPVNALKKLLKKHMKMINPAKKKTIHNSVADSKKKDEDHDTEEPGIVMTDEDAFTYRSGRKRQKINRLGVKATGDIGKEKCITQYLGYMIDEEIFNKIFNAKYSAEEDLGDKVPLFIGIRRHIIEATIGDVKRYILGSPVLLFDENVFPDHGWAAAINPSIKPSDVPNVVMKITKGHQVFAYATRNILEGEILHCDNDNHPFKGNNGRREIFDIVDYHKKYSGLKFAPINEENDYLLDIVMEASGAECVNELELSIGVDVLTIKLRTFFEHEGKKFLCNTITGLVSFTYDPKTSSVRYLVNQCTTRSFTYKKFPEPYNTAVETGFKFDGNHMNILRILNKTDIAILHTENSAQEQVVITSFIESLQANLFKQKCKILVIHGMEVPPKHRLEQRDFNARHLVFAKSEILGEIEPKPYMLALLNWTAIKPTDMIPVAYPDETMFLEFFRNKESPSKVCAHNENTKEYLRIFNDFKHVWKTGPGYFSVLSQKGRDVYFMFLVVSKRNEKLENTVEFICKIPETTILSMWDSKNPICEHIIVVHESNPEESEYYPYSIDKDFLDNINHVWEQSHCVFVDLRGVILANISVAKEKILSIMSADETIIYELKIMEESARPVDNSQTVETTEYLKKVEDDVVGNVVFLC